MAERMAAPLRAKDRPSRPMTSYFIFFSQWLIIHVFLLGYDYCLKEHLVSLILNQFFFVTDFLSLLQPLGLIYTLKSL